MAPKKHSNLRALLDKNQGRTVKTYQVQKQNKIRKQAEKRKRAKPGQRQEQGLEDVEEEESAEVADALDDLNYGLDEELEDDEDEVVEFGQDGELVPGEAGNGDVRDDEDVEWEDLDEEEAGAQVEPAVNGSIKATQPQKAASSKVVGGKSSSRPTLNENSLRHDSKQSKGPNEQEEDDAASESSIPYSDLSGNSSHGSDQEAEDEDDVVPHQRLTINNTNALNAALARIRLPTNPVTTNTSVTSSHPIHSSKPKGNENVLPFSAHQTITTNPSSVTQIEDIDDDLSRELAFYSSALAGAKAARSLLLAEGVPFSRPTDYFAEMVKSDDHMKRVKSRLVSEEAGRKASAEAKKMREAKKFGKAVQMEKQKERAKMKRDMLDKVNVLKRKRKGGEAEGVGEGDFDIALDDAKDDAPKKRAKNDSRSSERTQPNKKRQAKDQNFGFGGKKRFGKSGDAASTGDMRGYPSPKRAKAQTKKPQKQRPGKNRRATAAKQR